MEARLCGGKQNQIFSEEQTTDVTTSNCSTLISLAAFVDLIHVNDEKVR